MCQRWGFCSEFFLETLYYGGKKKGRIHWKVDSRNRENSTFGDAPDLRGGASGVSGDLLLSFDKETALLNET